MAKKKTKKSQKGKTVKNHPDVMTIDKMLLSGWSPARVHEWLVMKKKEPAISANTLAQYRANFLDPKMILDAGTYEKKLKQLDVQIDTLRELYNLIELQKRRLGYQIDIEDAYGKIHPDTNKELQLLRDTLLKALELEMELGIREKAAIEIHEKKFDMAAMLRTIIQEREERAMRKAVIQE